MYPLWQNFWQVVSSEIYVSRGLFCRVLTFFRGKNIDEEYFVSAFIEKLLDFRENYFSPEEHTEEKSFLSKKMNFSSFLDNDWTISGFLRKNEFVGLVECSLENPQENLDKKPKASRLRPESSDRTIKFSLKSLFHSKHLLPCARRTQNCQFC